MKVRYRFRIYLPKEQEQVLAQVFGCYRYVYNRALRFRTDAWFARQEKVGYNQTSAELTKWKREEETKWLNEVSCFFGMKIHKHLDFKSLGFFVRHYKCSAYLVLLFLTIC